MQTIEFSNEVLDELMPSSKAQNYRDIKSKLRLRVSPAGKKSFWVNIKSSNSKIVLGCYPEITIQDARSKALEHYMHQSLENLLAKVKQYEQETLLYSKQKVEYRWYVLSIKCELLRSILKLDPFSKDLNLKLTHLLKSIEDMRGPSACRKTYKKLCELLKASLDAKLITSQISIRAISKHIPGPRKRDIYIDKHDDMKAFLEIIKRHQDYEIFLVALLTCARIGDVIAMSWSQIDLKQRKWVYQPQKQMEANKEDVHVFLSKKVIEIIKKRKPISENKYVFNCNYLVVSRLWCNLRKELAMHLKHLNIHDLRRTHIHMIGSKDFLLVQHSLQHKVPGQTGVYITNSATFHERKKLITKMENKIFSLGENEVSTKY